MIPCPAGFYSGFKAYQSYHASDVTIGCVQCPAGTYCAGINVNSKAMPQPCQSGYYSEAGSATCYPCPDGHYCNEDGLLLACPSGSVCKWSDVTLSSKPRQCRAGYYCYADYELPCPTGSWSGAGASICTTIVPGQMWTAANHQPLACPWGYYQSHYATQDACQACPIGSSCSDPTKEPTECLPGTFSPVVGMGQCFTCPAGFYCDDPDVMPKNCASGSYSAAGWAKCAPCPVGQSCTNQQSPTNCAAGFYSPAGQDYCQPCPPGSQCPITTYFPLAGTSSLGDVGNPQTCQTGYYSGWGQALCTICPQGSQCSDPSRSPPTLCPQGQWSNAGSVSCYSCQAGQSCTNTPAANKLSVTPTVTTCTSAASITTWMHEQCIPCPAGYACPMLDFESIVPCGPGFWSQTNMTKCQVSNAGQYAPTTQVWPTPITNGSGYFAEIGFTYQTLVSPGYLLMGSDGRHNVLCKPGQISNNGVCTFAAAGTFAPLSYALSGHRTAGIPCPDGMWALKGSLECKICMPGYDCSSASTGKTTVPTTRCYGTTGTAAAAKYNIGGNKACSTCPDGYECSNGETLAPCPIWHYADSTTFGDCKPCPDGYSCEGGIKTACAAGFYGGRQTTTCVPCPPGYYCPVGSGVPIACLGGKYSNEQASSCSDCPDDYYSISGMAQCSPIPPGFSVVSSAGQTTGIAKCLQTTYSDWGDSTCSTCPDGYLCPEKSGFYFWEQSCPRGSYCIGGVQYLCPTGTFGVKERATSQADGCATCPAGYNCVPGTEHFMLAPCPPGAYCPEGSAKIACPAGTQRTALFGQTLGDCSTCAAGSSCGSGGSSESTAGATTCGLGYYCPLGTAAPGLPCPAGTFGGYKTGKIDPTQCLICPPGYYCPQASETPTPAPIGYYSTIQGADSINALTLCPPKYYCPNTAMTNYKGFYCQAGYFCPAGSTSATGNPCPAGTYSDRMDIHDVKQCTPCPRGFTCASASTSTNGGIVMCQQHNYCELGSSPTGNNACPAGTYAPYTRSMSLFDCLPCPAGSYCLRGAGPTTCPAGSYCPPGTQKPEQYLCPQGYYSSSTGLADATQCLHCGPGFACPKLGMTAPTQCADGYYNDYTSSAIYCNACPAGYYCVTTSVHPVQCGYGLYSDVGATACTYCPLGHYCPEPITTKSEMLENKCPAGTFCSKACTVAGVVTTCGLDTYPTLDSVANGGNACPKNTFCPVGTVQIFTNISAGITIQNLGGQYLSSAIQIPAGFLDNQLTPCPSGYYCPAGTLGSGSQTPCPPGTFRATTMGIDISDCGVCPAGYFCGSATSTPSDCPTGSYCPEGSQFAQACPIGTYNPSTNIQDSRQCTPCTAGNYCPLLGQSAVDTVNNVCDAGFICYGRAFRPEPTDFTTGAICPTGGYCLVGGTTQTQCPAGYIGLFQGAFDISACVKCPAGYYCKGSGGGSTAAQKCPAGYFCPEGSSDYASAAQLPLIGSYTTIGQPQPILCPIGYYQIVAGQPKCLPCPQGFFCNSIGLGDPSTSSQCPLGFYCPSYTSTTGWNELLPYGGGPNPYEIFPCPAGTYLNLRSKSALSDCIPCPAGKGCEAKGITVDPTSDANYDCAAGFYCKIGSPYKYPYTADPAGNYGPCPAGNFCPAGSSQPTPCPAGKFSNQVQATSISYCMDCPPGFLCATAGLTAPNSPVAAGYTTSSSLLSDTLCATSSLYCPLGTFQLLRCPTGYYQDQTGQGYCFECPAGQYCMNGAQQSCPPGYVCI